MSDQRPYSKVQELSDRAQSRFAVATDGTMILNAIMLVSGILSAGFFWHNSRLMFSGWWIPLGFAMGLLTGLLPAEGAYFGWKRIRQVKTNMTSKQLSASGTGLIASVIFAIFSTFALFVTSFTYVPDWLKAQEVLLVFLALSIPICFQIGCIAYFAVNERTVVENHERAKLGAMGFDAWIMGEQARIQSIIDGMSVALDKQLEDYGLRVGNDEAGRILGYGSHQLLEMGDRAQPTAASESPPLPTETRSNEQPPTRSGNEQPPRIYRAHRPDENYRTRPNNPSGNDVAEHRPEQPPRVYRDENGRERDVNF